MIRIIDNKKIDLTDDEWGLYQSICKSYDGPNFRGADLFIDLFETDNNGIIVFLKPPKYQTSFEVFLFLISIMNHQHLRAGHKTIEEAAERVNKFLEEAGTVLKALKGESKS